MSVSVSNHFHIIYLTVQHFLLILLPTPILLLVSQMLSSNNILNISVLSAYITYLFFPTDNLITKTSDNCHSIFISSQDSGLYYPKIRGTIFPHLSTHLNIFESAT